MLAEMLEILILFLDVMRQEVCPFGLEINWSKTKIQTTVNDHSLPSEVMVAGTRSDSKNFVKTATLH